MLIKQPVLAPVSASPVGIKTPMEYVPYAHPDILEPIATNAYPVVPDSVVLPYNAPLIVSRIPTIPPSVLVYAPLDG
jgi:hypothetical protein